MALGLADAALPREAGSIVVQDAARIAALPGLALVKAQALLGAGRSGAWTWARQAGCLGDGEMGQQVEKV